MSYRDLFESWKILFDYCCWVKNGGEALYGDIRIAETWCASLMAAMTAVTI